MSQSYCCWFGFKGEALKILNLSMFQASLRGKVKQLQAMKGELDMRHAQCDDYKIFIKRMQASLVYALSD